MKKIFAVALLLLSFAGAAMADGPFLPPPPTERSKPALTAVVQMADGPMLPPPPSKPPEGMIAA